VVFVSRLLAGEIEVETRSLLRHELVEMEVAEARMVQPEGYHAVLRVSHVYFGDRWRVGDAFEFDATASGVTTGHAPSLAWPLPPKEKMVWAFARIGDRLEPVIEGPTLPRTSRLILAYLPQRQGHNEAQQFEEVTAWARAVEETSRATPAKRYEMLKQFTKSKCKPLFRWSIAALGEADPPRAPKMLEDILERDDLAAWQRRDVGRTLYCLGLSWFRSPQPAAPNRRPLGSDRR
jgi:hypothetical protein